jgi:hypothetical protein
MATATARTITSSPAVRSPEVERRQTRRDRAAPGTTLADVTEFGMQGTQAMGGTLYAMDVFMLGADFLPGRETFAGALFATGATRSGRWSVAGAGRDPQCKIQDRGVGISFVVVVAG